MNLRKVTAIINMQECGINRGIAQVSAMLCRRSAGNEYLQITTAGLLMNLIVRFLCRLNFINVSFSMWVPDRLLPL